MAMPIMSRLVRGRLYCQTADPLYFTIAKAASAWTAADRRPVGIAQSLEQQARMLPLRRCPPFVAKDGVQ